MGAKLNGLRVEQTIKIYETVKLTKPRWRFAPEGFITSISAVFNLDARPRQKGFFATLTHGLLQVK